MAKKNQPKLTKINRNPSPVPKIWQLNHQKLAKAVDKFKPNLKFELELNWKDRKWQIQPKPKPINFWIEAPKKKSTKISPEIPTKFSFQTHQKLNLKIVRVLLKLFNRKFHQIWIEDSPKTRLENRRWFDQKFAKMIRPKIRPKFR